MAKVSITYDIPNDCPLAGNLEEFANIIGDDFYYANRNSEDLGEWLDHISWVVTIVEAAPEKPLTNGVTE